MNGRKLASLILAAALMLAAFSPALAELVKTPYEDGSLNVRKGPGTNYAVETWVKNGQKITLVEKTGAWAKVIVDASGKTGYIKANYIISDDDNSWEKPEAVPAKYELGSVKTKFAGSTVNVRKGPGTAYAVAFSAASGETFAILGESGNWYLVKAENGKTGYISKNYTEKGISAATTANVNLRSGAGTAFSSYGVIARGTGVKANAVLGNWTNVTVNGTTGYIFTKYLK